MLDFQIGAIKNKDSGHANERQKMGIDNATFVKTNLLLWGVMVTSDMAVRSILKPTKEKVLNVRTIASPISKAKIVSTATFLVRKRLKSAIQVTSVKN